MKTKQVDKMRTLNAPTSGIFSRDSNTMRYRPTIYRGEHLNRVAFPLGGTGAGMVCLEGTGALSHVSLRHKPEVHHEPAVFAALWVKGCRTARVVEGLVPRWKTLGSYNAGNGTRGRTYGLPRFASCEFSARFPFGTVRLRDPGLPVEAELTGWSPFVPGDADASCLPVAALEYRLKNRRASTVEGVFSFHAANFMALDRKDNRAHVRSIKGGFVLSQPPMPDCPAAEGHFAVFTDAPRAAVDCAWFRRDGRGDFCAWSRGDGRDSLSIVWQAVQSGRAEARPPHAQGNPGTGGSVSVPFRLRARGETTIRVWLAWYVPVSDVSSGLGETHVPWYAGRFSGVEAVVAHWREKHTRLRAATVAFRDAFHDTTLPREAVEAAGANLAILKSPTCLRQKDGRFWGWEGCCDDEGSCHGSCTHVWNYAQALPHLFPSLERTLRETEFGPQQDERGHQNFRATLPIQAANHHFHAAADGQLGGLMKLYRDWRISGDTAWMKSLWPSAKRSLTYCIETWDPEHTGTLVEPHHNTYDIEFWGPNGMCTSFYLGALQATIVMGKTCGEDVSLYEELARKGKQAMEKDLWNGEYFIQRIRWQGLRATDPAIAGGSDLYSAEGLEIMKREGPKSQYGNGCLVDGVLGDWMARCCGVPTTLEPGQIRDHLEAVFRHNFRTTLEEHSNLQRPGYAFGKDAGLLMCAWPYGDKPSLPFPFSDEVWTGCEHQAASHLVMMGRTSQALRIVRAVRKRYDGRWRNPFDEYECGHWYARAMASYSLLQAFSGARYDAVEKTLYLDPSVKGDFRAFLSTAGGYAMVGMRRGKPFLEIRSGKIEVRRCVLRGEETPLAISASRREDRRRDIV
jgi:uncharacterized protein (DUF608 family)